MLLAGPAYASLAVPSPRAPTSMIDGIAGRQERHRRASEYQLDPQPSFRSGRHAMRHRAFIAVATCPHQSHRRLVAWIEIFVRFGFERPPAAGRAEVVRLASILGLLASGGRINLHATYRIHSQARLHSGRGHRLDRIVLLSENLLNALNVDRGRVVIDVDLSRRNIDVHQPVAFHRLQSARDGTLAVLARNIGDIENSACHTKKSLLAQGSECNQAVPMAPRANASAAMPTTSAIS